MNRLKHRLAVILAIAGLLCVSFQLNAFYYGHGYPAYLYHGYAYPYPRSSNYPVYPEHIAARGYFGPKWRVRGYIDRYGDYWLNVKVRNISQYDMYLAWLWFNAYRGQ